MRRAMWSLAATALLGCPGTDKDDTATCVIIVKSVYPADGSTDGYYRAAIDFELSNPDPTAVITTDIPGTQGTSEDGKHILWTPDAPLAPETSYSATLDFCGGSESTTFTTSVAGNALTDAEALVGNLYQMDLRTAHVTAPPGLGEVLLEQLSAILLLGVDGPVGSTLPMTGAASKENETTQDYCNLTVPLDDVDFSGSPDLSVRNDQFTLYAVGTAIDVFDLAIDGTFLPDGSAMAGVSFSGTIDTRPLAPYVDDGDGSEAAICELAVNFNTSCVVCPSDGQEFCLELAADRITAPLDAAATLVEVCEADVAGCEDGPVDTCEG